MASNGNGRISSGQQHCTAREKKLRNSIRLGHQQQLASMQDWTDDDGKEDSLEWKTPSSDILGLKQSLNFECSNSIPINFSEAWSFFQASDMSQFMAKLDLDVAPITFRSKFSGFMGNPPLKPKLTAQRDLIFAIAACPMNNDLSVHRRILQSIYVFMTKNPSCPRYGNHWEEVGFQGQDPASDFRGVGMLGALQLLYLSSSQETKDTLAPDLLALSRHPIYEFPLAVLSLNVTKMTLDAFRDGILNRFCNKKDDAISVLNRFYLSIMYRLYRKWKDNKVTVHNCSFLMKAVEKWCRTHPRKTFAKMNKYLAANGSSDTLDDKKPYQKLGIGGESNGQNLSWLDLTKPSLEVFI